MNRILILLLVLLCSDFVLAQIQFTELPDPLNSLGTRTQRGVALGDFDLDGDDDILISCPDVSESVRLYRNDITKFTEITTNALLDGAGSAQVCSWIDTDDDGYLDIILGNANKLQLWHNNGNNKFENRTVLSGLAQRGNVQSISAGDVNNDNRPDIFVAYFYAPAQLYINYGNDTFRDRATESGLVTGSLPSMSSLMFDYDQDEDLDIYCVYDGNKPNQLFVNNGSGMFSEKGAATGLNTRSFGMGVDFGDFNNDGLYDLYISNLYDNFLLIQQSNGVFVNQAETAAVNDKGMGWGVVVQDFNLDGFHDIFLGNQFGFSPFQNRVYRNVNGLTFNNDAAGTVVESSGDVFGCATSDLNRDGLPDLVVANDNDDRTRILLNSTLNKGQFISIKLIGRESGKYAIGTKVKVYSNGKEYFDVVTSGSGYQSQNSNEVLIGVPANAAIDSLKVFWISGVSQKFDQVTAGNFYMLSEGDGLQIFEPATYASLLQSNSLLGVSEPPDILPQIETSWSVAHMWNEVALEAIRNDFARPTHHARNLYHLSGAMYDAWAAYSSVARPFFLGNTVGGYHFDFDGVPIPDDSVSAQEMAISYAACTILKHRYKLSPGASATFDRINKLMELLGYDPTYTSTNYLESAAALGNYIASEIIEYGLSDGSNEAAGYANKFYSTVNPPLPPAQPGSTITDPNRWQPLALTLIIDQNGNIIPGNITQNLSPEWGNVVPFAMKSNTLTSYTRNGNNYNVYHDPGLPPLINPQSVTEGTQSYQWNFALVAAWSGHLDGTDETLMDISPAATGNSGNLPTTLEEYKEFYDPEGIRLGSGYATNPVTGTPYTPQLVKRGDFTRVLAEFWADGPRSETPPGHWFTIFNYISDDERLVKKIEGKGNVVSNLEWDVKGYFLLGGGLHDAAVTAWSIKGYYDYVRPISAIRYLSQLGQSSDPAKPNYNKAGMPLIPGVIELVTASDNLAVDAPQNINKIKIKAWKGPNYIIDPKTNQAGVDWILGEFWWPYQRPTFVTPPFAGYISGHSTFSRTAATILTLYTGSEYFPGGYSDFKATKNEYLVFEEGPSEDISLQWAKYVDASDQCSLSRIWGGIHPPADDIPGRKIGIDIGNDAFNYGKWFFTKQITSINSEQDITEVFPNPAESNSILYIKNNNIYSNYTINTISGVQVKTGSVNSATIQIPEVSPGIYILKLHSGNTTTIHKLRIN